MYPESTRSAVPPPPSFPLTISQLSIRRQFCSHVSLKVDLRRTLYAKQTRGRYASLRSVRMQRHLSSASSCSLVPKFRHAKVFTSGEHATRLKLIIAYCEACDYPGNYLGFAFERQTIVRNSYMCVYVCPCVYV